MKPLTALRLFKIGKNLSLICCYLNGALAVVFTLADNPQSIEFLKILALNLAGLYVCLAGIEELESQLGIKKKDDKDG